jgi:DMSO/TMAO reductase YedYZ molybdopterin-dependent catalytic subunit
MQVLKRHKILVLITILLVIALVVSVVVLLQNAAQPSTTPTPTLAASQSPNPTGNTPNPTTTTRPSSTFTATSTPTSQPSSTSTPSLFSGEVTQYQGQSLTPVSVYIAYLNAHPDVAIAGVQNIDSATYKLAITGMVNNPTSYSYDQVVNGFNSTLQVATLPCVEGWSVTMLWQGVPITEILNQTGVGADANTLIFLAADGYSSSLPLDYVKQNNIMIAYKMNNVTFTPRLGWPFFLVAKDQYGYKWVEWVTEINVSNNSNYLGYWESRGYPNNATVPNAGNLGQFGGSAVVVLSVVAASVVSVAVGVVYYRREKRRQMLTTRVLL